VTVAVVTKPFAFEGTQRRRIADAALAELAVNVDAIITIPNDRVADVVADDASMLDAFKVVDDVVLEVVRGITDLLDGTGLINLDFADVRAIMHGAGPALIGLGRGSGEGRAVEAARQAVASPLLEADIKGARGILFNVAGPPDLRLSEVRAAADEIRANADSEANVIFGASLSRPAGSEVRITLIATGLEWPEGVEPSPILPEPAVAAPGTVAAPGAFVAPSEPIAEHREPVAVPVEAEDHASMGVPLATDAPTSDEPNLDMPSFLRRGRTE
jgi:cell division protein FtsZ